MGLRFRKSIKIAPGVRVNVGKKSASVSFGGKGMRYSISTTGRKTKTVGIPGTGLSYSTSSTSKQNYKTNAYQNYRQLQAEEKRIQKQQELEYARHQVAKFENQCEVIQSIHKESDDPVDWKSIYDSLPPFQKGSPGLEEQKALQNYHQYKPNFFEKIFKQEDKKRTLLEERIKEAKQKDQADYQEWEELVQLAKQILQGDIDAYYQVIEEMEPLADLSEFGSGFEFGTDDPTMMEVEFDVHSDSVVPKEEKKLTKTGKLSTKAMPKTRYYELQQDYVCSCIIRIARDLFALLPVEYVIIHAFDEQLNTETGHYEKQVIVSAKIDRRTLNQLNLDLIDCSDALNNFPHNMNFRKTKGFAPVEKMN